MENYEFWNINGHELEFMADTHTYLCDCYKTLPSITQILKTRFGGKYAGIDKDTLQRAADKGTEVHKVIEDYCREGKESELPELRNFKFLQKKYEFEVKANEIPVILFLDGEPISAGRLDLVLEMDGKTGLGDIKRTSSLDKEYLGFQLNLYRIAFNQCYGTEITFLKGVHLRDDVRKFVDIPINEQMAWELVHEFLNGGK